MDEILSVLNGTWPSCSPISHNTLLWVQLPFVKQFKAFQKCWRQPSSPASTNGDGGGAERSNFLTLWKAFSAVRAALSFLFVTPGSSWEETCSIAGLITRSFLQKCLHCKWVLNNLHFVWQWQTHCSWICSISTLYKDKSYLKEEKMQILSMERHNQRWTNNKCRVTVGIAFIAWSGGKTYFLIIWVSYIYFK